MIGLFVETLTRMTVEDGSAKGHVIRRIAVTADRHVPARHHEFKLLAPRRAAGFAKQCDAVLLAEAA
jgi:hypothetical protein